MAEVRKYGLSLVFSNQLVAQIDGRESDVACVSLGNTGKLVSFWVGQLDTAIVAEWPNSEVSPHTIMRVPHHYCIVGLMLDGACLCL